MTAQGSTILAVLVEPAHGQPCHCFCGVRHGEQMGVCEGHLDGEGRRVWFDSPLAPEGVVICGPCWAAFPEATDR